MTLFLLLLCSCSIESSSYKVRPYRVPPQTPTWRESLDSFIEHMEKVQVGWTRRDLREHAWPPQKIANSKIWSYHAFGSGHTLSTNPSGDYAKYIFYFRKDNIIRIERYLGIKTSDRTGMPKYFTQTTSSLQDIEKSINKSVALFCQEKYVNALSHLEKLYDDSNWRVFPWTENDVKRLQIMLSECYARAGEYSKAVQVVENLRCTHPIYSIHVKPSFYKVMGKAYYEVGKEQKAMEMWSMLRKDEQDVNIEELIKW